MNFISMLLNNIDFTQFSLPNDLINVESKIRCKDVLISASTAEDKRHDFLCLIVSCQDITRQKRIKDELQFEQEKYKKLADDYQRLANFDSLTGLPN